MTQEQQRNLLGISHERYDHTWLHLQAMPLPRTDQFLTDLQRIVARVMGDQSIATVHIKHLEDLILAGLQ